MKNAKVGSLILCASLLAGCATIPQPRAAGGALAVGRISIDVRNGAAFGALGADGTHVAGIIVDIKNLSTGKVIRVSSSPPEGLFYAGDLQPGGYGISGLFYEISSGQWAYLQTASPKISFTVQSGKVVNLGVIRWIAGGSRGREVEAPARFAEVRKSFSERYPASAWNNRVWIAAAPQ